MLSVYVNYFRRKLSIISYMKNNFAKNLRLLRKQENLKQSELAEKLSTTQRKISYWESGKYEPDINDLISLSEIFNVSIDDLIK